MEFMKQVFPRFLRPTDSCAVDLFESEEVELVAVCRFEELFRRDRTPRLTFGASASSTLDRRERDGLRSLTDRFEKVVVSGLAVDVVLERYRLEADGLAGGETEYLLDARDCLVAVVDWSEADR